MWLWWTSLEKVSMVNSVLQWVAGIAATIAGIATVSVVILGSRQNALQKIVDVERDQKVAEAKKLAEELHLKNSPWALSREQIEKFVLA
jgi:hypothetical protein